MNELVESQLSKVITRLFKNYLTMLQELQQDSLSQVYKYKDQLPADLLASLNVLDLPKYSRLRKRVLDQGNDAVREMKWILSHCDVSFKQNTETKHERT